MKAFGDALKVEWPVGLMYTFWPPNIIQLVLGRLVKWGEEVMVMPCWLDQSWFPEMMSLVTESPRRFQPSKWLLCNAARREAIPMIMRDIKLIAWKLSSHSIPGVELQTAEKMTDSWTTNYQWISKHQCSFHNKKGLPTLEVSVSDLVEYLDFLQVNHDYCYGMLNMHASVIRNILQPTEQTMASSVPIFWHCCKWVFRRNPPAR